VPTALPSRCTEPGCGRIATQRGRCDEHKRKAWANRSRNTAELTGAQRQRFHAAVFRAHGDRCAVCGEAATDADHVVPVAAGGSRDPVSNGQPLCREHHEAKSMAERKG